MIPLTGKKIVVIGGSRGVGPRPVTAGEYSRWRDKKVRFGN